jgi:hypothetical protein
MMAGVNQLAWPGMIIEIDRDRASEIRAAPTVGDAFPPRFGGSHSGARDVVGS